MKSNYVKHYRSMMKKMPSALSPVIAIDRERAKPLHRQIYDAYRAAILNGNLIAGQQVPSTRVLASELRVSRIPVLNAYAQLRAEGYFDTTSGAGTFVSRSLPERMTSVAVRKMAPIAARFGRRSVSRRCMVLPKFNPARWLFGAGAFTVGQLALDQFPLQDWSALVARHCKNVQVSDLHFSDPMGSLQFRETISSYLRTARAVNCDSSQIMVVSGSQQAIELTTRILLDPGDSVWLEEPGYRLTQHVLALVGCRAIPVPVDEAGLDVSAGIRLCRNAKAAYVTPSHQYPLGATMSASRRFQLLEWANQSHAWIVEDDYDSEYRYKDMPIASLQGLDSNSRVIYIGTFSKTLFPSLRLGYIVIPTDLIERFATVRLAMDLFPPYLYQAVLCDFIKEGHFARHLRRTRLIYAERRRLLVEAITNEFDSKLQILGAEAGMHLVAIAPPGIADLEISERAAKRSLWLWPLSNCYRGKNPRQGFILGFGNTPTNSISSAVKQLRAILF